MPNFEGTRRQRLEWIEARVNQWQSVAASIGISSGQAASVKTQTLQNRADFAAAETARNAAKAATLTFYNSGDTLAATVRGLIAAIKGYAESTHNPNVYALANIEPNAAPTPAPAPATPTDFTGSVTTGGDVVLRWKAVPSGPSTGIFFVVRRKRGVSGSWTTLGGTAEKSFLDPDPQLAGGIVTYQVMSTRGTEQSEWTNELSFDIAGAGGGGGSFSDVVGKLSAGGEDAQAA